MKSSSFATRLPTPLLRALDDACRLHGLRKTFVVETALREKLEDLADADELRSARRTATGFHAWDIVKREARSPKSR